MQKSIGAMLAIALFCNGVARAESSPTPKTRYVVVNLSTPGEASSQGSGINDHGLISGFAKTLVDATTHAVVWRSGTKKDLGTLGGANSAVVWPVKNNRGVISGISQTNQPDPLNESWSCSVFIRADGHTCLGFVWVAGEMRALMPLPGGNNSFATGTNNRLQTVGWAENGVHDPHCNSDPAKGAVQVLQFLPVIWGPGKSQIKALPLLPGDDSGAATAINDRGDVIGISGSCDQAVGRHTAKHMVLWKNGRAMDMGNLGGNAWNTPMALNQRGDVVGFANTLPGESFNMHAFYRHSQAHSLTDMGVLHRRDTYSQALGINDKAQVVGVSCGRFPVCHAFVWKQGVMTDLNDLVAPGYSDVITAAQDINNLGKITGQACRPDGSACHVIRVDPVPEE